MEQYNLRNANTTNIVCTQLIRQQATAKKISYWVEMIQDMVDGLDYSYSRIAKRIGVSSSTIQKLATHPNRKPRPHVFHSLASLYHKLFFSELRSPQAEHYLKLKQQRSALQQRNIY